MDPLRFGYQSWMQTIQGGDPVRVVWFRVPDSTPAYTGTTVFRSRNWEDEHENDGIGEQEEPTEGKRRLEWYSGHPPAMYHGGHPCGSDLAAQEGALPGRDPIFQTNAIGQAPCCASAPETWEVGDFLIHVSGEGEHVAVGYQEGAAALLLTGQGGHWEVWQHEGGGFLLLTGDGGHWIDHVHEGEGYIVLEGEGLHGESVYHEGGGYVFLTGDGVHAETDVHEGDGGIIVGGEGSHFGIAFHDGSGALLLGGDGLHWGIWIHEGSGAIILSGDGSHWADSVHEGEGEVILSGVGEHDLEEEETGPPCGTGMAYSVVVSGITGSDNCTVMNQTYAMSNVGGQVWSATVLAFSPVMAFINATLTLTSSPYTLVLTNTSTGETATYQAMAFDCATGGAFVLTSATGCSFPFFLNVTSP